MTTYSYNTSLDEIKVYPELNGNPNVIRVVTWNFEFYDPAYPDVKSTGACETILPEPSGSFTDISQLSKAQILQWAFDAQGGEAYMTFMLSHHKQNLEYLVQKSGAIPYDISNLS